MAYTEEQIALLNATFDALPAQVKGMFNANSTQDTAEAITQVIAQRRKASMSQAVAALVSGSVSNWTALKAAAVEADGATLREALTAFDTALTAEQAPNLIASAVAACFAARKHFSITS